MTDLARRGLVARAERLDRAVVAVQTRLAPLFPGGEIQDTGRALWTLSATPLPVVNGVIRYDARDFGGPESDRLSRRGAAIRSRSRPKRLDG